MTRDLKKIIDGRDDLLAEKARLKTSIKNRKEGISYSFHGIREELNPLSAFKKNKNSEGGLLANMGSSPLVSLGVSSAANFLLKKFFLPRAGFLSRIFLPIVVKKASELIVAPKLNEKLVTGMRVAAGKIRETDVQDVVPDAMELAPEAALNAVAKTGENIAEKLRDAADNIRPKEKPGTLYSSALLKKSPKRKLARGLRKLAQKIRN